jgi:hypothetical protein
MQILISWRRSDDLGEADTNGKSILKRVLGLIMCTVFKWLIIGSYICFGEHGNGLALSIKVVNFLFK